MPDVHRKKGDAVEVGMAKAERLFSPDKTVYQALLSRVPVLGYYVSLAVFWCAILAVLSCLG